MVARALTQGEDALAARLGTRGHAGAYMADLVRTRGIPSRRDEDWKWTDLRAAIKETTSEKVSPAEELGLPWDHLQPPGFVKGLALTLDDSFLGEAFLGDFIQESGVFDLSDRNAWVSAHRGVDVVVIERLSAKKPLQAHHTNIVVAGGSVTRVVIVDGDEGAIVLSSAEVLVASGRYRQFVLVEGSRLARLETHMNVFDGANVELSAVYLAGERRHADITSRILLAPTANKAPVGSRLKQLTKGAARKGGRGVFQGRIEVARGAQHTDARQHHHGLLLEDGAEIYAKPELEIYADDVQCAHGNTAGALDEAALFYMRTRGIAEAQARAMLTEAFLIEAVPEDIPERDEIVGRIQAWLGSAS